MRAIAAGRSARPAETACRMSKAATRALAIMPAGEGSAPDAIGVARQELACRHRTLAFDLKFERARARRSQSRRKSIAGASRTVPGRCPSMIGRRTRSMKDQPSVADEGEPRAARDAARESGCGCARPAERPVDHGRHPSRQPVARTSRASSCGIPATRPSTSPSSARRAAGRRCAPGRVRPRRWCRPGRSAVAPSRSSARRPAPSRRA